jgi:hypothetical protein
MKSGENCLTLGAGKRADVGQVRAIISNHSTEKPPTASSDNHAEIIEKEIRIP